MSSHKFGVAICTLNQLCLDFQNNFYNIIKSIERSIELGASIRIGPELEITGYGCEDAFYEIDTVFHSWQVIGKIIERDYKDIIIVIGMPILKDSSLYNCAITIYNSKIVYIRAKNRLAISGNYRENRYFTPWKDGKKGSLTWFKLPSVITEISGQTYVPFGDGAILEILNDTYDHYDLQSSLGPIRIGFEICEELWQPDDQNSYLFGHRGCHLIANLSSSYWEIRKLDLAFNHVRSATYKTGGAYAYVNNIGCDGGGRLCFYGRSFVIENGNLLSIATDTTETIFNKVNVSVIFIDPVNIQQYRLQKNIAIHSCQIEDKYLRFNEKECNEVYNIDFNPNISDVNIIVMKCSKFLKKKMSTSNFLPLEISLSPSEEIVRYCSLWLWDYLRRCIPNGLKGFILPLSGGLDSSSVVCIVFCLCQFLHHQIYTLKNNDVIKAIKPLFNPEKNQIARPQDLCNKLLRCCYLQTKYSGEDSLKRAKDLSSLVGAEFQIYDLTHIYETIVNTVPFGIQNNLEVNIQQQNVQARLRMVLTYYMSECNRLVLATGNVDEALVGYLTKYDCSSADINPIGSISKKDLKIFLEYCKQIIPNSEQVLDHIINAVPSAELTGQDQKDEEDLGLTYDELSLFGKIRRGIYGTFGPYGMFCKIWNERQSEYIQEIFPGELEPALLAKKVKRFFRLYSRNRHKQTILTPSLHTETYSPDDNRFDHRQFLFNTNWPWQFKQIDELVKQICAENSS